MNIVNLVLNDFTHDNRVLKISELLQSAGHQVTVAAVHRNHLLEREKHAAGFEIHRIRTFTPSKLLGGAIKWAEFCLRIIWTFRSAEVWHCNDAEAFVIGLVAKTIRPRIRLVYDCHEFESERNGKPAWYNRKVGWVERRFIRKAEAVLVVSPSIEKAYRERYGRFGLKGIHLVRNVPNRAVRTSEPSNSPMRQQLGLKENDFLALYQGKLTWNRGVEELLEMAPHLEEFEIHLAFMGYGELAEKVMATATKNTHVHFIPAVAYADILTYTADADVGLVSVKPTCLSYLYCLPNKLFECIQAGVPVLVNELPDCEEILQRYSIGKSVSGLKPQDWLNALVEVKTSKINWKMEARSGFLQAQEDLNWETESLTLVRIYREIFLKQL